MKTVTESNQWRLAVTDNPSLVSRPWKVLSVTARHWKFSVTAFLIISDGFKRSPKVIKKINFPRHRFSVTAYMPSRKFFLAVAEIFWLSVTAWKPSLKVFLAVAGIFRGRPFSDGLCWLSLKVTVKFAIL